MNISQQRAIAKFLDGDENLSDLCRNGENTLHDYLETAEAVYFGLFATRYDPSIVRRELAEKKGYLIDNGFLTALSYRYSDDRGKLLENLVAIELRRRGQTLLFAKGQKECDFVAEENGALLPIQASVDLSHPPTKEREVAGLLAAASFVGAKRGIIVTLEHEEQLQSSGVTIDIVPCWKFLMGPLA